jgi:hypothetical protein
MWEHHIFQNQEHATVYVTPYTNMRFWKMWVLFFQITDFCWAMHRFPCQNTNSPTFPEHICWNLCMAQPKKSIWTKNALIFSRISYLSMCHLHSYMFLLLKIWCSQVAFGNEHAFWERTFFFDIEKNISFFWWCYLIFYTFLCCGYLWYLC